VLQRADGAVVFRATDDNRVERVLVETGLYHEGMVEIASGIATGDRIVVRGQFRLTDGQPVSLRTPAGEAIDLEASDVAGSPR
jgi:multidrug efflux pump subunit AcrA (membrane-fusion protein)